VFYCVLGAATPIDTAQLPFLFSCCLHKHGAALFTGLVTLRNPMAGLVSNDLSAQKHTDFALPPNNGSAVSGD